MQKIEEINSYIIDCMCLRLHEKEALSFLRDHGFKISAAQYYKLKKEVKESSHTRLNLIGSQEFVLQHLDRLDTLKTIHNELWANYHLEKVPSKKANILMQIAEIQQYLSSYYDSTQYVMQQAAKHKQEVKEVNNN
jgi:hypothetical protein